MYTVAEVNSKGWIVDTRHETDDAGAAIETYLRLKDEEPENLFDIFDDEALRQADAVDHLTTARG